ncbi:MAG: hypothetical protein K6F64_07250 [Clostridia bacterium]|nr:hypothetical protein [Clostridia bacterium]
MIIKFKKAMALLIALMMISGTVSFCISASADGLTFANDKAGILSGKAGDSNSSVSDYAATVETYDEPIDFIENDYVQIAINKQSGRYSIGTTGGNPESDRDNHVKMLYGHPIPGTSYTTFRIDGENKIYGPQGETGLSSSPSSDYYRNVNTSAVNFNGITVRQILSVIKNNSTNREDVVEIRYEVTNNTSSAHTVGTRIMLDTMLDGNDYAPFKIPINGVVQDVTTQMEFTGDNIPAFWQALDSLENPGSVSQGTFIRSSINPPDKVQFTNWPKVFGNAWEEPVVPGEENGDSAVTITWYEEEIPAGRTKSFVTHYGLSQLNSDLRPPLAVSIYSDNFVNVVNHSYSPNPIDVVAYVENIGDADATGAYAKIIPGEGLSLASGAAVIDLGTVRAGDYRQVAWQIKLDDVVNDTMRTYTVEVGSNEQQPKTLTQTFLVPSIFRDDSGDTDGDGLLDSWETRGADFDGDGNIDLPLDKMGADPYVKDVYVEVDCIQGSSATTQEFFDKVAAEYERHNIRLHIDFGANAIDYVTKQKWSTYPGGTGSNTIPAVNEENVFSVIHTLANTHFTPARTRAFHYCVYAPKLGGAGGWAYLNDQLFAVLADPQYMDDWDKGAAFMHELGHNLGLRHGGDDNLNNKPNYLSNMNYLYSYDSVLGYRYSDYDLFDIDENNLNEAYGIDPAGLTENSGIIMRMLVNNQMYYYPTSKTPIDFNLDGDTDDIGVKADLSNRSQATEPDEEVSYDILTSQNDWDALSFKGRNIGTVGATVGVTFDQRNIDSVVDEPQIKDLEKVHLFPENKDNTGIRGSFIHILKNPGTAKLSYREKLQLTCKADFILSNQHIEIYSGDKLIALGEKNVNELTVTTDELRRDTVITAKIVDDNKNLISDDSENVEVSGSLLTRIIAFFKGLVGSLQTVIQS